MERIFNRDKSKMFRNIQKISQWVIYCIPHAMETMFRKHNNSFPK